MMFGVDEHGRRATATPDGRATCPACGGPLVPKCGPIVVDHWAHRSTADCDPWAEPISEWHLAWQALVPPERREVVIDSHRADVVSAGGLVVEVQHSAISLGDVAARETFYGRMIWIVDVRAAYAGRDMDAIFRPEHVLFRFARARPTLVGFRRPVLLDLGGVHRDLLWMRGVDVAGKYGWGHLINHADLASAMNADDAPWAPAELLLACRVGRHAGELDDRPPDHDLEDWARPMTRRLAYTPVAHGDWPKEAP